MDCVSRYAAGKLGEHNANLTCMDQSGCQLAFPESELRRFLTPKLLELYDRVKQRKEIEAAGLENLEECPFCEYRVVIDNEQEKLFRCEREDCGAVSCRACKRLVRVHRHFVSTLRILPLAFRITCLRIVKVWQPGNGTCPC